MSNLLKETTDDIVRSGHSIADIIFIGSADGEYSCTWDEFTKLADLEYYEGYGAAKVADDLVVGFADGQKMWRFEYDGSEGWEFDIPSSRLWTGPRKPITRLIGGMWSSVQEMQAADFEESA